MLVTEAPPKRPTLSETFSRPSGSPAVKPRLAFLDWTRGLAVLIMLQGHVFHSFIKNDLRNAGPYVLSQLLGGEGPAIFLVLTGITLAFLMDRSQRQQLAMRDRWLKALRRAGYLFMLAFLFRLQMWVFAFPGSPWTDLFKVDVLNCMGLTIGLLSVLSVLSTAARARAGAVVGVLIAAAAPLVSDLSWKWLPDRISAYFVPNYNYFALFPWGAFIAFGVSLGSILRLTRPDQMFRTLQWAALAGFGLIVGGEYFSNWPYSLYPHADYWLNGPGLIAVKLGVVLVVMAAAYVWTEFGIKGKRSWLIEFGMTSLLIYWVHIELVYGRWFGVLKSNLTAPQCVVAAAIVISLMAGLAALRLRWKNSGHGLVLFSATRSRSAAG